MINSPRLGSDQLQRTQPLLFYGRHAFGPPPLLFPPLCFCLSSPSVVFFSPSFSLRLMKANDRPWWVRSGRQRSCRINVAVCLRRDLPNYRLHSQLPPDEMWKGGGGGMEAGSDGNWNGSERGSVNFFSPVTHIFPFFELSLTLECVFHQGWIWVCV